VTQMQIKNNLSNHPIHVLKQERGSQNNDHATPPMHQSSMADEIASNSELSFPVVLPSSFPPFGAGGIGSDRASSNYSQQLAEYFN